MKNNGLKVLKLLDIFLKERRESDGGWAPVTEGDMAQFHDVIEEIINAKWGADPDGDRPINYSLIDRTRYEPSHFFALPYAPKDAASEEMEEYIDTAMSNVRMALERLEIAMKLRQDAKRRAAIVDPDGKRARR